MSEKELLPLTQITENEELPDQTQQTSGNVENTDVAEKDVSGASVSDKEMADNRRGEKKQSSVRSTGPKSPSLIRAVLRGSSSTSSFFQERNLNKLDIKETDSYQRNAFHYAISKPNTLKKILIQFSDDETKISVQEALHQADREGETPMHRAARIANTESLELLHEFDKTLIKDTTAGGKRSMLHLAIRSKSMFAAKFILSKAPDLLNVTDNNLQTPVHYAASLQQSSVMELLISQGADTTQMDANDRLPIHVAASKDLRNNVELLLREDPDVLDVVDGSERSPLILAARNGFPNMVSYLLGKNADYTLKDKCDRTAFDWAITRASPEVVQVFLATNLWKEILSASYYGPEGCLAEMIKRTPDTAMGRTLLNKCVTTERTKGQLDYQVTYDFLCLESRNSKGNHPQFEALEAMVENVNESCLSHPVTVKYVDSKWRKRGFKYNLATILSTLVFHICLMIYTSRVIGVVSIHRQKREHRNGNTTERVHIRRGERPDAAEMMALRIVILIFTFLGLLREIVQVAIQGRHYFVPSNHYVLYRFATIITVLVFLLPVNRAITVEQLQSGAVVVLLSWVNLLQFLKFLPVLGIYIIVVQKVFWTLMKVLIVVLIYLLSFATTFYVLLAEHDSFRNISMSVVSTFVAMIDGIDYSTLFVEVGWYKKTYEMKMIILVLFLLTMSIVVNNALIGLAVGDTNEVMKSARCAKFLRRAKFVISLERGLNGIPRMRPIRDEKLVEFPGRQKTIWQQFWDLLYFGSKLDAGDGATEDDEHENEVEITLEEHIEKSVEIKLENLRSNLRQELKEIHDQIGKDRRDLEEKMDKILAKLK